MQQALQPCSELLHWLNREPLQGEAVAVHERMTYLPTGIYVQAAIYAALFYD